MAALTEQELDEALFGETLQPSPSGISEQELDEALFGAGRVGVEQDPQATVPPTDLQTMDEAAAIPQPTGEFAAGEMAAAGDEPTTKQQALMGLINEDPELQMLYLKRQGFNTRLNPETGTAEYEQASGRWVPALEGITQYWPNIVEGLVGAAATGARALGAVGAPATGGASIGAAAGLGGAASAGLEAVKQGAAYGLGLREEMDPSRIGVKGLGGAVGAGGGEAIGQAVGAGARGLKSALIGRQRDFGGDLASKEAVKSAAKELEVVPTRGMLTKDPTIRKVEAALDSLSATPAGTLLRMRTKNIRQATQDVADELVSQRSLKTSYEVGKDFSKKVKESIAKKLEPAEKIYNDIREEIGEIPINREKVKEYFKELQDNVSKGDYAGRNRRIIDQIYKHLNTLENVEDVKTLRTEIPKTLDRNSSQSMRELHDSIYEILTKVRSDSFDLAVRRSKDGGNYKELLSKLKEADKIWKDTSQEVAAVFSEPGKQVKFGPKALAAKSLSKPAEKSLERFFPRQDVDRAKALYKLSPEGFQELAVAHIAEVAKKAELTGAGKQGVINIRKVAQEIDNLSPEIAQMVYGVDNLRQLQAAKILFRNAPFDINPSGSGKLLDLMQFSGNFVKGIGLKGLGILANSDKPFKTVFGQNYLKNLSKAGLITGTSAGLGKIVKDSKNAADKRDQE